MSDFGAVVNGVFWFTNDTYVPTLNVHHVYLRYLAFCVNSGVLQNHIPSSLSLFWNIQTLIINNIMLDISLPYEIWEMTQLRHVVFAVPYLLYEPLPSVMNVKSHQETCTVLENLHTLLGVRNLRLTEEVCRRMPNIKNLSLSYYDVSDDDCSASSSSYHWPYNLSRLNKLESLKCEFGDNYKWPDVVLSFLLPTSLKELSLSRCHWKDLTKMIESLPSLESFELRSMQGPGWDLAEEEFPCLKKLEIADCNDLIDWNANSSHFPVLEFLNISSAPKLSEIPFDIGEIPTLRCINLHECSMSAAVSAMRIVVEQESLGNDDLLLEVDFWEMEQVERFQTMLQEECLMTNNLHLSCDYKKVKAF